MHPVVFRVGSYTLYWYSALLCLGILLGVGYAVWRGKSEGYRTLQVLDAALWALVGGLLGARLAYVIPNWGDYASHPAALLKLWGGGLVFQGGLIGGTLTLWLYARHAQLPFLRVADVAAPAVALAQAVGWAGAHLHGAHYGLVMRSSLSMWLPDLYGVYGPRVPIQFLACALGLFLFWGLNRLHRWHLRPGTLALLYLLCNGIGHFGLEFARADDATSFGLLRATQIAGILEFVVAGSILSYVWIARRARAYRPEGSAKER